MIYKVVDDKKFVCLYKKNSFKENKTKRINQIKKTQNQSITKLKNSICDKNHKIKFREKKT